jgi:regulator-associated protein of mTOR
MTAIASDEPDGNVFVSGFGDGVVRLFDKRMQDASNIVMRVWRQHHTWIQSVHLQKGGQRELITGRCVPSFIVLEGADGKYEW